ncbi:WD repeat-containing protein 92 [Operophtera brumata]|uniref:WD repeat-containing protein 92 n=1 Tax=Operophtera brumata TaxID=104452 RepID=A0A0L7L5U4_OPEBR|nr:WD repeat-containing protein 92 [Operophtera brumata]
MEELDTPQIITHIEKDLNHSLFDCKWIPCSAKFVVIGSMPRGTGTIEIFEITAGEAKKIKEIERPNSFKDLEMNSQVYITKEHTDIINSIDAMGGNTANCGAPEIVTGSRDGKPVANMQPVKGETKRDCWTVAFGNSFNDAERIVAAGYDNGDLKMFDLRTMSLRWECNLKNGVCYTEFDRKNIPMNKLVATTLEGKFHNRDLFVTCAGNGQVSLWKYEYPEQRHRTDAQGVACGVPGKLTRLQRMVISSQPINALEWNRDHLGLAVATAYDQCVRIIVTTKLNLQ